MKSSTTEPDPPDPDRSSPSMPSIATRLYLSRHMRVCWVPEGAVLLDLKCNRYYGLATNEATSLHALLEHILTAEEHRNDDYTTFADEHMSSMVKQLLADGILCIEPVDRSATAAMKLEQPIDCVGRDTHSSRACRPRHLAHFMHAYWWAKSALQRRSLLEISDAIAAQKTSIEGHVSHRDLDQLIELVNIFKRLRAYTFTARDQCLFHALVLTDFLLRQGIAAIWCIGVKTRPWAAHSWVQANGMTLDCTPEQIREYTPILAV